jgi:hypothetical protein
VNPQTNLLIIDAQNRFLIHVSLTLTFIGEIILKNHPNMVLSLKILLSNYEIFLKLHLKSWIIRKKNPSLEKMFPFFQEKNSKINICQF